jgi:hypothetical protein
MESSIYSKESKIWVKKPVRKRSLGRPKYRWEDIFKWILKETWCEGVDWIWPVQDRVQYWAFVNTIMNFNV